MNLRTKATWQQPAIVSITGERGKTETLYVQQPRVNCVGIAVYTSHQVPIAVMLQRNLQSLGSLQFLGAAFESMLKVLKDKVMVKELLDQLMSLHNKLSGGQPFEARL